MVRKQGCACWEEHSKTAWKCRDGIRKAVAQLEINQEKWGIVRRESAITSVRKGKENKLYPLNEWDRVSGDKWFGEPWGTSPFFFLSNCSSLLSWVPEPKGREWENEIQPVIWAYQVLDCLRNLNIQKSWDPMRCTPGSFLLQFPIHSLWYLKSYSSQAKSQVTGKEEISWTF